MRTGAAPLPGTAPTVAHPAEGELEHPEQKHEKQNRADEVEKPQAEARLLRLSWSLRYALKRGVKLWTTVPNLEKPISLSKHWA